MSVTIKDPEGNKPQFAQWECDRLLVISGTEDMPICRFAHPLLTHALVVNGEASGNDWTVKVPNFLLQFEGRFAVSVVVENSNDEVREIAAAVFVILPRQKPQDYEYTDNIGYVNWVLLSQQAQDLIDEIQEKLDNGELKGDPFVYSDFTEEQLAALKGEPGDDGVSPGVSVSTITGGHRVTITDKDHPTGQSFDVMDGEDSGGEGQGLSDDVKQALLQLAQKVAYIDAHGSDYYQDLYDALYPSATLTSITANFNQGSTTVYTTDTLDSLKTDLTVTAHYDDGTSEVVTNYTLSGNLTVGTSIITVSYGGKTANFNVTVTRVAGTFSIANNLTGCTNSNSASTVAENASYNATITANTGYTLTGATVSITMEGSSVTGYYSNGTISIPNVTGDVVITVAAVAVTVSSISAVFNQGAATIYDTDSLDTLKQYLVVTATYSDSSTATVPSADYTLSGTLAEGTSTITVAYGGKNTTISVTVTHNDDADWDYIWRYTDGLPPVSDWTYTTGGGSGQVHSIIEDGMLMTSKYGTSSTYDMSYAPSSIASANGCTAEFSFYIPDYSETITSTVQSHIFEISVGNGTNGIMVVFNHPKNQNNALNINLYDDTSAWYGGTKIGNFQYETPYTIRMEMDAVTMKGRVYINETLASTIDDLTTIAAKKVQMYTGGVGGTAGGGAVVQSVKLKYENPNIQ